MLAPRGTAVFARIYPHSLTYSYHKQCKLQLIFLSKQVMLGRNQGTGGDGDI